MTTATRPDHPLTQFAWTPQPEAEALVDELVGAFLARSEQGRRMASRMSSETGTRFQDWIDHLIVRPAGALEARVRRAGWVETQAHVFKHPLGNFPDIVFANGLSEIEVAIEVESVADFAAAHCRENDIQPEEEPLALYRWLPVSCGSVGLTAVERHGYAGWGPVPFDAQRAILRLHHRETFRARRRNLGDDEPGFELAEGLIESAVEDVGRDVACDAFFAAEREFWMRRNRAAQVQYARQQRLGLGWANHDHHTYRSSREHFARLIAIWEKLGFACRERFYAGAEAGWGAQVMEHPVCGIVTFNDVDLSPDELMTDFAHEPLPPRKELGTVGLWCALHGESFLEAGMHHLECTFDFEALKRQLESEYAIKVMKPFTDLPHLRQAFTEGERWPVRPERIDRLLADGRITAEQAEKFRTEGAIGSHLENLERNAGFKGFNQKGVSEIIAATDPRKQT